MKEIRQRKADKEIEKTPKRKKVIEAECEFENDQIEEMWSQLKSEREGIEKRRENERKPRKLEELIGMKIKEILFDSNIHKWNRNDSEFATRID